MDPTLPDTCPWPIAALPRVIVAGYHPLSDRAFRTAYRLTAAAIHLYDYAGEMRLGARAISLRPGDLTITPPGIESRYDLARPGRHWVVHAQLPAAGERLVHLPLHLRLGSLAPVARERLTRVAAHHRRARGVRGSNPAASAADAALLELVCWLAEQTTHATASRGERAVERAAELLRERAAHPWRAGELARAVGLSPAYLARSFRRRFGHTLARFQLLQRIGAAQALLACTALPVAEVGRRVGLPDPHHFNKLFRRVAGQPPSAFRAEHRG